jgi:hypothetical protein
MIELPHFICCVCGARLPNLPRSYFIEAGCALKRNDEQYIFFCINRHTKEEIAVAVTGVPKFKTAAELKV